MVEINWTQRALCVLVSIAEFIAKDSKKYAKLQVNQIRKRIVILKSYPKSGRIVPELNDENIRELIHGNYRIVNRIVSTKRIDVLTIHHSSRRLSL